MIRIGVICPSEIAFRRFMPSLAKIKGTIEYAGIGYASPEEWFGNLSHISDKMISEQQERERSKVQSFSDAYGGKIFDSYQKLITSSEIDAVYIPLPPALHYKWAKMALEQGKHVLVEKPSTICLAEISSLINIAREKKLAIHENYMFIFHNQIKELNDVIRSGEIGDVRLYRITFGFPMRSQNDFRYNKSLGGGALLDAGGYCIKYADSLLGGIAKIVTAQLNDIPGFEVEMYGSATMVNDAGQTAQLAFGMDNDYRCDIEIWGSKGTITSNRILTAPAGYLPTYVVKKNQDFETRNLPTDDAFEKSINHFIQCILEENVRLDNYKSLIRQEKLIDDFKMYSRSQK